MKAVYEVKEDAVNWLESSITKAQANWNERIRTWKRNFYQPDTEQAA